jgi:3,4-dihydroxy 2-butanone 4-phosphate synthase/GTP cyclohydrolase II
LQDKGFDTVDAQTELGLPVDAREYAAAAAILTALGIESARLLTNNPRKVAALRELGAGVVGVERLQVVSTPHNHSYLRTKRDRMGHDLVLDARDAAETA